MGARCSDYYQITMRNATLQSLVFQFISDFQTKQAKYLFIVELTLTVFAVYSLKAVVLLWNFHAD